MGATSLTLGLFAPGLGLLAPGLTLLLMEVSMADYQICVNKSTPHMTDEQRLLMVLMADYNKATRPVFNASHPVHVKIGITLTQIFDVDERNQVLTSNVWLDQEWTDEKLHWNPADYNNLEILRIPCGKLWLPDIVLYNSADDYTHGYMQALAMVKYDGGVFWPPIVKLRSTCQLNMAYFPFDDQLCKLKLGSWAYDGFQVNVDNRTTPIDLSNFVGNGEWELIGVTVQRNVVYYPCCVEPFPDVTFMIHVQRRTLYYTYNVIIPCIMLSILTLMGFWMRPDSGEKVTLGLTVLLAFSVFMLLIAENMPATSNHVPLIGVYLTIVMTLTSVSVIVAVGVSSIHNKGYKDIHIGSKLRRVVLILSKIVFMKLYFISASVPEEARVSKYKASIQEGYTGFACTYVSESGCNLIDYENGDGPQTKEKEDTKNKRESSRCWETEEILRRLHLLLVKEENREKESFAVREWQEAAEVLDRFMFWIFIFFTLLTTLVLLWFVPLSKNRDLRAE